MRGDDEPGAGTEVEFGAGARAGADAGTDLEVEVELVPEVADTRHRPEVLDLAPERVRPGTSRAGWASPSSWRVPGWVDGAAAWGRRHPRRLRAVGAAALAVGLLVAALVVRADLSGPPLPKVVEASPVVRQDEAQLVPSWAAGVDGRPSGPVTVTVDASLTLRSRAGDEVRLIGLDGPGVLTADRVRQPVTVAPDGRAHPLLVADIDCTRVPTTLAADAYGLRVQVRDDTRRTTTGTVPAGAVSARLGELVQRQCGPWLARQSLTVVAASARNEPDRAAALLDLTIANSGDRPGRLERTEMLGLDLAVADPASGGELSRIVLAPHRETTVRLRVNASRCDGITAALTDPGNGLPRRSTTLELLSLTADTGPAAAVPPQADTWHQYGEGVGPTGIVIAAPALPAVTAAVSQLCAGLRPAVALTQGLRRGPRTGTLLLDVTIDVTPGRVRSVTVTTSSHDDGGAYVPLWSSRSGLTPDRTGQLRVALPYRPPPELACPYSGAWLPPITVLAQVPDAGTVRTVRFENLGLQAPDGTAATGLCR